MSGIITSLLVTVAVVITWGWLTERLLSQPMAVRAQRPEIYGCLVLATVYKFMAYVWLFEATSKSLLRTMNFPRAASDPILGFAEPLGVDPEQLLAGVIVFALFACTARFVDALQRAVGRYQPPGTVRSASHVASAVASLLAWTSMTIVQVYFDVSLLLLTGPLVDSPAEVAVVLVHFSVLLLSVIMFAMAWARFRRFGALLAWDRA